MNKALSMTTFRFPITMYQVFWLTLATTKLQRLLFLSSKMLFLIMLVRRQLSNKSSRFLQNPGHRTSPQLLFTISKCEDVILNHLFNRWSPTFSLLPFLLSKQVTSYIIQPFNDKWPYKVLKLFLFFDIGVVTMSVDHIKPAFEL
jgi:hypothetical protein